MEDESLSDVRDVVKSIMYHYSTRKPITIKSKHKFAAIAGTVAGVFAVLDIKCHMSNVKCQNVKMSKCQMSKCQNVKCQMSKCQNVKCQKPNVKACAV